MKTQSYVVTRDVDNRSLWEKWEKSSGHSFLPAGHPVFAEMRELLTSALRAAIADENHAIAKKGHESPSKIILQFLRMPTDTELLEGEIKLRTPAGGKPSDIIISLDELYSSDSRPCSPNYFRLEVTRRYDPSIDQIKPLYQHQLHSWIIREVVAIADAIYRRILQRDVKAHLESPHGHGYTKPAAAEEFFEEHRVLLHDDGLFTGGTLVDVSRAFMRQGIPIHQIDVGISQRAAVERMEADLEAARENPFEMESRKDRAPKKAKAKKDPRKFGFDVVRDNVPIIHAGGTFGKDDLGESVLWDWICERDFFVGFPRSGKTIFHPAYHSLGFDQQIGVPYLQGWNPKAKESLRLPNANLEKLTADLNLASRKFWKAMNKHNAKTAPEGFKVKDAPRFPFNLPSWNEDKFCEVREMDIVKAIENYHVIINPIQPA